MQSERKRDKTRRPSSGDPRTLAMSRSSCRELHRDTILADEPPSEVGRLTDNGIPGRHPCGAATGARAGPRIAKAGKTTFTNRQTLRGTL